MNQLPLFPLAGRAVHHGIVLLLLLLLSSFASGTGRGDWWMFHHDAQHTGRSSVCGPNGTAMVNWAFPTGAAIESSPAIADDGTIYVGSDDHKLYALNPDGTLKWAYVTGNAVVSSPTIDTDGTIYVGSNDGYLYALHPDGTLKWRSYCYDAIDGSPVIDASGCIEVSANGYDSSLWTIHTDGTSYQTPFNSGSMYSMAIGTDEYLNALSPTRLDRINVNNEWWFEHPPTVNGSADATDWSYVQFHGVNASSPPVIKADGSLLFSGYSGSSGYVCGLNQNIDISTLYEMGPMSGRVNTTPAIGPDGTIYAGSDDHKLYALQYSPPHDSRKWMYTAGGAIESSPAVGADGIIYFGCDDHKIYAVNANGTLNWTVATGGMVRSSPALVKDVLYVGSSDGKLYAIGAPKVSLYTTVDPPCAQPGDRVTYSLTYRDYGNHAVTQVVLTDPLPANLSYVQGSVTGGGSYQHGTFTWWPGTLADHHAETFTVSFQATVNASTTAGTRIDNTATLTCAELPPTISNTSTLIVAANARSGCWMLNRDAQHTGHSPAAGPTTDQRIWVSDLWTSIESAPAIAADGTIYVGTRNGLYALTPNGGYGKWRFDTHDWVVGTPAIAANGTVFACSHNGHIYAVNPDGSQKWDVYMTCFDDSPMIGPDGLVYIGGMNGGLYAFDPNTGAGQAIFTTNDWVTSPAFGLDGTIYVASHNRNLYALTPDGHVKWVFSTGGCILSAPAIGANGTIYVGSNNWWLYAVNPDGTEKWHYGTGDWVESTPAIGADGTVYVGSHDHKVYAIKADGTAKWVFLTSNCIDNSPTVDANNHVYIGNWDGNMYGIDANGQCLWSDHSDDWAMSPALTDDGTLIFGSNDHHLLAINNGSWSTLALHSAINPTDVMPGKTVTCILTVQNIGRQTATQVMLTDVPDSALSYVAGSATGGGSFTAPTHTLSWSLGTLLIGDRKQVTFQAVVSAASPPGTLIGNRSTVQCAGGAALNDACSVLVFGPVMMLQKTVAPTSIPAGGAVTYTLSYANTGNASATNVQLTDILPSGLTYVAGSASGVAAFNATTHTLTWTPGMLNAGASAQSMSFKALVGSSVGGGTNIVNTATIVCTEIVTPVASSATLAIPAYYQPDLAVCNAGDAAYLGLGVINSDGANQSKSQTVVNSTMANYFVQVKNAGNTGDTIMLTCPPAPSGWTLQCIDQSTGKDVTNAFTSAGVNVTLAMGTWNKYTLHVTPNATVYGTYTPAVTGTSGKDRTKKDVVKAAIIVAPRYQPDLAICNAGEATYTGLGVLNLDGANQTKSQTVANSVTAIYYVQVKNSGNTGDTITLTCPPAPSGWTLQCIDQSTGKDVTNAFTSAGAQVMLAMGTWNKYTVRITPGATVNGTLTLALTAVSRSATTNKDVVKTVTTVPVIYQPDLAICNYGEASYTGLGIVNLDGANQTKSQTTAAGTAVHYLFEVKNVGNTGDSFTITCLPPMSGWKAQFIDRATGSDITTAITSAGFTTRVLAAGVVTLYTLHMTPAAGVLMNPCSVLITATSTGNAAKKDAVKAVTTKQ